MSLTHFRNYARLELDLPAGVVLLALFEARLTTSAVSDKSHQQPSPNPRPRRRRADA